MISGRASFSAEDYAEYRRQIVRKSQRKRRENAEAYQQDQQRGKAGRLATKKQLVAALGGACKRCGWKPARDLEYAALEFHHREPHTKKRQMARSLSLRLETVTAEAKRCDLLCSRCHRITEAEIDDAGARTKKGGRTGRPARAENSATSV